MLAAGRLIRKWWYLPALALIEVILVRWLTGPDHYNDPNVFLWPNWIQEQHWIGYVMVFAPFAGLVAAILIPIAIAHLIFSRQSQA